MVDLVLSRKKTLSSGRVIEMKFLLDSGKTIRADDGNSYYRAQESIVSKDAKETKLFLAGCFLKPRYYNNAQGQIRSSGNWLKAYLAADKIVINADGGITVKPFEDAKDADSKRRIKAEHQRTVEFYPELIVSANGEVFDGRTVAKSVRDGIAVAQEEEEISLFSD